MPTGLGPTIELADGLYAINYTEGNTGDSLLWAVQVERICIEAKNFCGSKGKNIEVVTLLNVPAKWYYVYGMSRADLYFKCVESPENEVSCAKLARP